MSQLTINLEKCTGCGLCIKSCATDALHKENNKAMVNENCTLCGICIDSCPFEAISIEKENLEEVDLSLYEGIWVFAEQQKGEILPVVYELLGKGKELSLEKGCKLTALIFADEVQCNIQKLISYGADRVIFCEDAALAEKLDENYIELFDTLINKHKPDILLFGATGFGRSLAPRVAARVGTGLTADCTLLEIDKESGLLQQTRPAFGGNLMATIICPNHRPQMATVRPGVLLLQEENTSNEGEVIAVPMPTIRHNHIEILEEVLSGEINTIADAKIIVSVGRGIGSQKNMSLVHRLAELIGGNVGVTRSLVDIGWSQYENQIGQTGSTVAPKLLIACGISGAIQHLAGISNAETIIVINSDPDAPIFSVADYKVVGDCVEVIKKLIATLED
ncbi:Electron transfer flavoprotein, alpha subunit-like protein [Alkaliphilus metalliredigens QYMF]|uniref:Electron transfer flavoprotein, alpha subunit-like protein n=1 Tax=Alkaliphilus metalliredigens (strain QYMF) TaxID=293826 RepID=A6TLC3_ALKMQ|nr:electron transfer flavoprotein subunit alpha [Alkaliphilus metalliredigens]ABR46991.1 Electron transfer flavoprotein, alpha subunit-like protein [Alkaliphilus metalliredigens QYMF]